MNIKDLHELSDEILELQQNYSRALNYIAALRITQASMLKLIKEDRISTFKEFFFSPDIEKQIEKLKNSDNIINEIQNYPYDGNLLDY